MPELHSPERRVLIVGVSSLIGANLACRLRDRYRVFGTYRHRRPAIDSVPCFPLTIDPQGDIQSLVVELRPEALIYCAGEMNNQLCEADPFQALYLNAEAPAILTSRLQEWNGRFIYLSTSKIFSGEGGEYSESDPPAPQTIYGHTKLQAEQKLSGFANVFVLRLGTLYGLGYAGASSMLNRLLVAIWQRTKTPLIDDELRNFLSVETLARAMVKILEAGVENAGLYHLGGASKTSYYAFGTALASALELQSPFTPVSGEEFSQLTESREQRGRDLSLNSESFCRELDFNLESRAEGLSAIQSRLRRGAQ